MFQSVPPTPPQDSGATPATPTTNQPIFQNRSPFGPPPINQPVPDPGAGISNPNPQQQPEVDYTPLISRLFNPVEASSDALFEPVQTMGDPGLEPIQAVLSPTQQPRIIVMDTPRESGFSALIGGDAMNSQGTRLTERQPAIKAHQIFETQFGVDKHFVSYGIIPPGHPMAVNNTMQECPRLSKASLGYMVNDLCIIPDIDHVVGLMIVVDMDLPGHARWETDVGYTKTYADHFEDLDKMNKILSKPSFFYKTRSGARLGYLLSRPIPVTGKGGLEDKIAGIIHDFYLAGIPVDYQCVDWTRLFRANNVKREGDSGEFHMTGDEPYYSLSFGSIDLERVQEVPKDLVAYDPNYFGNISDKHAAELQQSHHMVARSLVQEQSWLYKYNFDVYNQYAVAAPMAHIDLPNHLQITDADVAKIIKDGENDSLFADVKAKVKTYKKSNISDYVGKIYETIFANGTVFLNETTLEGFHGGVIKTARGFMNILFKNMQKQEIDVGYTFIYACVLQAAIRSNDMRTAQNRPDARSSEKLKKEVSDICSYTYKNIKGELEQEKKQGEELGEYKFFMEQKVNLAHSPRELASERLVEYFGEDLVTEHFNNLVILDNKKLGTYVLYIEKNGYVHYVNCTDRDLITALKVSGHSFVNYTKEKRSFDEEEMAKQRKDIILHSGYPFTSVSYHRTIPDIEVTMHRHPLHGPSVQIKDKAPGMRMDITPCYNEEVDKWLRLIGGPDPEKFLDWLATYPMIEHPNCALYLEAHARIGKDLLAAALKSMTESNKYADFEMIIGNHQDDLFYTPFIWFNEGADEMTTKTKNIAARFKKMVTDNESKINPKGTAPVDVIGYNRVLITGNNDKLLHIKENLSGADTEAIADRLFHIKPLDEKAASDHILSINTKSSPDGKITSNYWPDHVIPGHIMHLYEQRAKRLEQEFLESKKGSRFLVQGELTEFHRKQAAGGGSSPLIVEILGQLMDDPARAQGVLRIMSDKECVRVHLSALTALIQKSVSAELRYLKSSAVKDVLSMLSENRDLVGTKLIPGKSTRCHSIPLSTLIEKLYDLGFEYDFREVLGDDLWKNVASEELQKKALEEEEDLPPSSVIRMPEDKRDGQGQQQRPPDSQPPF